MNYLLDTNVISELMRQKPNHSVIALLSQTDMNSLYLSVLSIGEIRKGIEKVLDPKRKQKMALWLEQEIPHKFHNRILPINLAVADRWGRLQHQTKRSLSAIDSLIAATALHHDMTLVTRNTKDFCDCAGLEVLNPWM